MKKFLTIISTLAIAACGGDQTAETEMQDEARRASPVAVEIAGGNPVAEHAALEITDPYMRGIIQEELWQLFTDTADSRRRLRALEQGVAAGQQSPTRAAARLIQDFRNGRR